MSMMSPFSVSLVCLEGIDASLRSVIRAQMSDAGIDLIPSERREHSACVVLARDTSAGTAAAVSQLARNRPRLVVVTPGPSGHDGGMWQLLRAGADDVITWVDARATLVTQSIAARLRRWREVDQFVASPAVQGQLVGHSEALVGVLRQLVEVAWLPEVSVLITGESGTGKELAARLIHSLDRRATKGDLVIVDCTTIVPTLAGSELFGHERGAFTDAIVAREGAVAAADGGTLFLDELGELPPGLQAELLRVVQEGTYKRVGSNVWRSSRFRLICATNRDLREDVATGRFRTDLYHRIAAWTIRLPPLAERADDIPELVRHFVHQLRPDLEDPVIDGPVDALLQHRAYPGNIRELRQVVSRLCGRHVGPSPITVGDVPLEERPATQEEIRPLSDDGLRRWLRAALRSETTLRDIRKAAEETAIEMALEEAAGNLHSASLRLKVTDRALQLRRAAARRNES
jgi:transcriptional regulator with GAF, ATPase, and Fis domain